MGYQSKTYSLSDEVVGVIEQYRACDVSPNQLLSAALLDARNHVAEAVKVRILTGSGNTIARTEKLQSLKSIKLKAVKRK